MHFAVLVAAFAAVAFAAPAPATPAPATPATGPSSLREQYFPGGRVWDYDRDLPNISGEA
ncbi:MAG: hypothetical protein M1826_006912 [Phylliscum demangeonii]|nr:MAG: hypothetical protein M1826_006912 [Phylliscum demangeonii]